LAVCYLTPDPSPARSIVKKREVLLAGEGSIRERGLRPLSLILSPSHTEEQSRRKQGNCVRGG